MDEARIKESRVVARRIHEHVLKAHGALGAREESAGMVDVVYHPESALPELNFVTPRRNTAFVSSRFVQQGIDRLLALKRVPRVMYMQVLYPAPFGDVMTKLGLELEYERTLMLYPFEAAMNRTPTRPLLPPLPEAVRLRELNGARGAGVWRGLRHDTAFEVKQIGAVPLALNAGMNTLQTGKQFDVVAYANKLLLGIVRVEALPDNETGHLLALAVRRDPALPALAHGLVVMAMKAAARRGCSLVFTGSDTRDATLFDDIGFTRFSALTSYAAPHETGNRGNRQHDAMAQPILSFD